MSDYFIRFIPVDYMAQPSKKAAEEAVTLLQSFVPESFEVTAEYFDTPMFVDAGSNWAGVRCPACGSELDEHWWGNALNRSYEESRFKDIAITMPCCGAASTLNDFVYAWPCGLARFQLEAMNPNIPSTTAEQDAAITRCLGMPLRKVHCHL